MKHNPDRYSSQVGEVWAHFMFKVKYCHNIFDVMKYRNACHGLILKACRKYEIRMKDEVIGFEVIGFDSNHLHTILGMGLKSKPEITKKIKGFVCMCFDLCSPLRTNIINFIYIKPDIVLEGICFQDEPPFVVL